MSLFTERERLEIWSVCDSRYQFYQKLAQALGRKTEHRRSYSCITGAPLPANVVFNLAFRPNADSSLRELHTLAADIRAGRSPNLVIVDPLSLPADLSTHLRDAGFCSLGTNPLMFADVAELDLFAVPDDDCFATEVNSVNIESWAELPARYLWNMTSPDDLARCVQAFSGLVSSPEFVFFLVTYKGEPVASSLLFVQGKIAGVYCVSVHPSYRKLGLGRLVTQLAVRRGVAQGCDVSVLFATAAGFPVYQKMGYRQVGLSERWHLEGV